MPFPGQRMNERQKIDQARISPLPSSLPPTLQNQSEIFSCCFVPSKQGSY